MYNILYSIVNSYQHQLFPNHQASYREFWDPGKLIRHHPYKSVVGHPNFGSYQIEQRSITPVSLSTPLNCELVAPRVTRKGETHCALKAAE